MRPHFFFISLFLPLLILIQSPVRAQSDPSTIDSLQTLLTENPHDTVKIDTYIALHRALLGTDESEAMENLQKAIALSEKMNDKKRISEAYIQSARFYDQKGMLPEAQNALAKAEEQLKHFQDTRIEATFFMLRGIIYYYEGTYNQAVADLWEAIPRYEALEDTTTVGSCYLIIGTSYLELDNLDKALEYYEKGLAIYKQMDYQKGVAMATGNIGMVFKARKDYEKALEYYNFSLQINEKHGYKDEARIDLNNIGNIHQAQGEYEKAEFFHRKALEISNSLDNKWGILSSEFNLAFLAYKLGHFKDAITRFNEIIETSLTLGYKEFIKDANFTLSEIYENTGNHQLALDHRKEYEIWKDSLLNENHLNQIKELEIKYETAKKSEEIAMLSRENELRIAEAERQATWNRILIGGLILSAIIAGLVLFLLRQRLRNQQLVAAKNEEIKTARFKQQLSELEMKALRAQMNPHFIFNCMNSINRMILSGDGDNASRYLTKFSKLIRLMLENSEQSAVPLQDELAMLEAYIQLEALRFKGKISYRISVDDAIDQENTLVPSMVLQPFIENAIWHGLMHKNGEGLINVFISEDNDILRCVIEDNGVGREKALELQEKAVMKHQSMGLQITEERLRLLNSRELRELIRITDLKDSVNRALGTRVDISIPIA